jgi:Na+/phosphate symporter
MQSLDQFGRTGTLNHMIRRKATASESGLNTLKDIQAKVLYLPLTAEGVFGEGLEDKLEKRKEQSEQLKELVKSPSSSKLIQRLHRNGKNIIN